MPYLHVTMHVITSAADPQRTAAGLDQHNATWPEYYADLITFFDLESCYEIIVSSGVMLINHGGDVDHFSAFNKNKILP